MTCKNPFEHLRIDSLAPLHEVTKRTICPKCNASRKYFCYKCYIPMREIAGTYTTVDLPVTIDIIKHPKELDGKSTAVHARLLAPDHVTIYTYPDIPQYEDKERVILVFPSKDAISLEDLIKNRAKLSHPPADLKSPGSTTICSRDQQLLKPRLDSEIDPNTTAVVDKSTPYGPTEDRLVVPIPIDVECDTTTVIRQMHKESKTDEQKETHQSLLSSHHPKPSISAKTDQESSNRIKGHSSSNSDAQQETVQPMLSSHQPIPPNNTSDSDHHSNPILGGQIPSNLDAAQGETGQPMSSNHRSGHLDRASETQESSPNLDRPSQSEAQPRGTMSKTHGSFPDPDGLSNREESCGGTSEVESHSCKKHKHDDVGKCLYDRVVFIDSTWHQCKIISRDERLSGIQRVILEERLSTFWRTQANKPDTYLATIEAIYYFLVDYHCIVLGKVYGGQYDNLLFFYSFMYGLVQKTLAERELVLGPKSLKIRKKAFQIIE